MIVVPKNREPFAPQVDDPSAYFQRNKQHLLVEKPEYLPLFQKYYVEPDFLC